jgi:Spy/CpxP family protein refolding chaperone
MISAHRVTGCLVAVSILFVGVAHAAQPQSRTGQWARAGYQYYYNPMEQSIQWLQNEGIQKEIELVPEQKEKIDKIRKDYYDKTRQLYKDLQGVDPSERYKKLYEKRKQLSQEVEQEIRKVLLKNQVDRMRQIMLQMALRQYGSTRALNSEEIAKTLNITDEQKVKLQEVEREARQEMQKKYQEFYKKLREEMLEKILGVLDDKQRAQLKEMTGEKFEWRPTQRQPAGKVGVAQGT